jgi:hypothetical protein
MFNKEIITAVKEIPYFRHRHTEVFNIHRCLTLPGFAGRLFKTINKNNLSPLQSTHSSFKAITESIIGGISHCQYPGHYQNLSVGCVDIVSQYPSRMLDCNFPKGQAVATNKYVEGKLGVYWCKNIKTNQSLSISDVPFKDKSGCYHWNKHNVNDRYLTSVDIERVIKNGGTLEMVNGFYWKETHNPFKEFIEVFMKLKQGQDVFKNDKDDRYNPVLRQAVKLVLNSLYGKMCEFKSNKSYIDVTDTLGKTAGEFHNVFQSHDRLIQEVEEPNKTSLAQYGTFILAYSRDLIFNYMDVIGRDKVIQSETDSLYIPSEYISAFDAYISPKFGSLDVEIKSTSECLFIGKKCYSIAYHDDNGNVKEKFRFAGIPRCKLNMDLFKDLYNNGEITVKDITVFIKSFKDINPSIYVGKNTKTVKTKERNFLSFLPFFEITEYSNLIF